MVESVIKLLNTYLADREWIDRYSGVVTPVKRKFPKKDGSFISEILPETCEVSRNDCYERGKFLMTPDKRFKSVAYWEIIGDSTFSKFSPIPRNSGVTVSTPVRLVVWFNKQGLGYDPCSDAGMLDFDVLNFANLKLNNVETPPAYSIYLEYLRTKYTFSDIFGKYTYTEKWDFLFADPYGFRAYDFNLIFNTNKDCLPDFVQGDGQYCQNDLI